MSRRLFNFFVKPRVNIYKKPKFYRFRGLTDNFYSVNFNF